MVKSKNTDLVKLYGNVTIWQKWQIVLPIEIRKKLNLKAWDSLNIIMKKNKYIWLVKNENIQELFEYVNVLSNYFNNNKNLWEK